MKKNLFVFIIFLHIYCHCVANAENCIWKNYDFGLLDHVVLPWTSHWYSSSGTVSRFLISLCRPLTSAPNGCGANSSVCHVLSDTGISVGQFSPLTDALMVEDASTREISLTLNGDVCPETPGQHMKTVIVFKCGKSLGSPEVLSSYACESHIEWSTTAACKSSSVFPSAEVKCYIYDKDGNKRDLSGLVRTGSPYRVMTDDDAEMYINVCRDISLGSPCSGYAACLIQNKTSTSLELGRINALSTQLLIDDSGVISIKYISNATLSDELYDYQPSTKIRFRCPSRQLGRGPRVLSSAGYHYEIEWETEYACALKSLVSHTCQLNAEQHRVKVDLSPLASTKAPYNVSGTDPSGKAYEYTLNVCINETLQCGLSAYNSSVVACQRDPSNNRAHALGGFDHQLLRYADGQLSLTYGNGASCSSGFKRETVIHFHCNSSAGIGVPQFSTEDSCTYIFDWETAYACTESRPDCQVVVEQHLYDLSSLTRSNDMANWEMYSSSHRLLINVCSNVTSFSVGKDCPSDAAICLINGTGAAVNIGQFETGLSYDTTSQSLVLQYTDGDVCEMSGERYSATITFRCKLGDFNSRPSLLSADKCHFTFIWYTAAACAVGQRTGDNCRVSDPASGHTFDLNPLGLTSKYYRTSSNSTNHDYYINVCGAVRDSPCNGTNVGVCQVDRTDKNHIHNAGLANSQLRYYNGLLKLTYIDGDQYHSGIPRSTEIVFICDDGPGQPTFVSEMNHTYMFVWYTKYACTSRSIDCNVVDAKTNSQYDLSGLSHSADEGNWVMVLGDTMSRVRRLYINVCRPVLPLADHVNGTCDPNTGACVTEVIDRKETVIMSRASFELKVLSEGDLVWQSYDAIGCIVGDKVNLPFNITVHFHCTENSITEYRTVTQTGECTYGILWETRAACPQKSVISTDTKSCSVVDPSSGITYNLSTLVAPGDTYYSVNASGHSFKMNICGNVTSCPGEDVAVCDGNTVLGVSSTFSLHLSNGMLQLTYHSVDKSKTVVINFICNSLEMSDKAKPHFIEQQGDTYVFEMATSLVCQQTQETECEAYDGTGRKYDLSPLARQTGSWTVLGVSAGDKYYINVCHPVMNTSCTGSAVGGCHVSSNGVSHNMGNVASTPLASDDGTLSIRYTNGDLCREASPEPLYRSTHIMFHCSFEERDPVFTVLTDDCEYIIEWSSPYACPLQRIVGDNCTVSDPLYHVTFDLHELRSSGTQAYTVSTSVGNFSLNICGPVASDQANHDDCSTGTVGACLRQGGQAINVGNFNERLQYEDGQLLLRYVDGKQNCDGRNNRTTTIAFFCDLRARGRSQPRYLDFQSTKCSHRFEWPTSLACLPSFSYIDCIVTDKNGNTYDLSRLAKYDDNYEIRSTSSSERFIINVCAPVIHGRGVMCPPSSGACMIGKDLTNPNKRRYVNIGSVKSTDKVLLVDKSNQLRIYYEEGDECYPSGANHRRHRTIIELHCDQTAVDTVPQFVEVQDNCDYIFMWRLRDVCLETHQTVAQGNCSAVDAHTGILYDLSPLKQTPVYVVDEDADHTYYVSICQPVNHTLCKGDAGVCQHEKQGERRWFNAGQVTSNVKFTDGVLYLSYTNGDVCHHNHVNRSTVIRFLCNASQELGSPSGLGQPRFVNEEECTYVLTFYTPLACMQQVSCRAHSGDHSVDLSSLMSSSDVYTATVSVTDSAALKATFYIGVCRSVNNRGSAPCPVSSAACRRNEDGTMMSLGRVSSPPVFDSNSQTVTLTYVDGDPCQSGRRWRSTFRFICRENIGQGLPNLVAIDVASCEYVFEWATSAACSGSFVATNTGCKFVDEKTNTTFDLSELGANDIKATRGMYIYYVNMCGAVNRTGCNGAQLCQLGTTDTTEHRVRRYNFEKMVLEAGDLKLVYIPLDLPSNTTVRAVLIVQCDKAASRQDTIEVEYEHEYTVILKWKTLMTCYPSKSSSASGCVGGSCSTHSTLQNAVLSAITESIGQSAITAVAGSHRGLTATVGIVMVIVALVLIVVGVAAFLGFHSRGHAVGGYLRSCMHRFRSIPAGYKLLGSRGETEAPRESDGLLMRSSTPVLGNIQSYESDDDLLL